MVAIALTIAGSDPSGGAGVQADLKTFQAHGVYGQAAIALLTVQNSRGVAQVEPVADALIRAQVAALFDDMPPHAAKTGALPSAGAVALVAELFRGRACPLVVDPVLRPSHGQAFSPDDLAGAYLDALLPVASLFTPNAVEAEQLTGIEVRDERGAERAARCLLARGARAVLVKGGHFAAEPVDVLLTSRGGPQLFRGARVHTAHTHGTGCTYAAAITARLAQGAPLAEAIAKARRWLARGLAEPLGLGAGAGPVNHLVRPED